MNKVLPQVKTVLAVAAGKGGVGKSTLAVNLALCLKKRGASVGLLDADIYGPSLEQMLPEGLPPSEKMEDPEKLLPGLSLGIPFISVAQFKKEASIVRAPIANQMIEQFLETVEWGPLDYLIVDFPPGTGDIQLTLMQKAPLSGAIVVTTPQIVSTLDVGKAIQLFQRMEIPLLGVVENMSYLNLPGEERVLAPFGEGGGELLAKKFDLPLLAKLPIDPLISQAGDEGFSLFEREGKIQPIFEALTSKILEQIERLPSNLLEVRQRDPQTLEMKREGEWKPFSLTSLQMLCPCARCKGKGKGVEGVSLLEFSYVGRYAIRVTFSSGCSQGIYPLSLLETLAL